MVQLTLKILNKMNIVRKGKKHHNNLMNQKFLNKNLKNKNNQHRLKNNNRSNINKKMQKDSCESKWISLTNNKSINSKRLNKNKTMRKLLKLPRNNNNQVQLMFHQTLL